MIGDLWASKQTGNIYRVGPRGSAWAVVGHVDDLRGGWLLGSLGPLLGYFAAALGASVVLVVFTAAFLGLVLGAIVMYFPVAAPFSIPILLLGLIVVGIRSIATSRPKGPVAAAALAFVAVLVLVVLHFVYWPDRGWYVTIASLPIMVGLTLGLTIWAIVRARWGIAALLLGQSVVYAASYLESFGSVTYAESPTGFDHLLTLGFWICIAYQVSGWLSPRRFIQGVTERDGYAYANEVLR